MESKADQDEVWLFEALEKLGKRPTDSHIEDFCERVAIMTVNGLSDDQARREALLSLRLKL